MRELEFELGCLVVLQGYLRVKEQREKKVELRCWLMIEGGEADVAGSGRCWKLRGMLEWIEVRRRVPWGSWH